MYPYNNIIYSATFSEVLNQNLSDSSSSRQPGYLLASAVFLCSRSFSGCLNTKEVLLHESFHLKPLKFSELALLATLCWNQPACNLSHQFQDASKILCLPVCLSTSITVRGTPREPHSYGFTSKMTMLGTEETSLKHISHSRWLDRLERPTKTAAQIYICR